MTKTIKPSKWRTVIHRDGRKASAYEVSEDGEVRSYKGRGVTTELRSEPRILKGYLSNEGYRFVAIAFDDGKTLDQAVHILVCCAFNGHPPLPGAIVRHCDGNKVNNHRSNLAWGTQKENAADRANHGTAGTGKQRAKRELAVDLPGEIWAPILFKPTDTIVLYEASNFGRIKSYSKPGPGMGLRKDAVILPGTKHGNGYLYNHLRDADNNSHRKGTHQWIMWAFEGSPPEDAPYVLHKDGDKSNNRRDNLYYGTARDNGKDAMHHGVVRGQLSEAVVYTMIAQQAAGMAVAEIAARHGVDQQVVRGIVTGTKYTAITDLAYSPLGLSRGAAHYNTTLTEADVLAIVERLKQGDTLEAIADDFGVGFGTISAIKLGRNWSHLTGIALHKPGVPKGECNAKAKLTADKVREIRQLALSGRSQRSIAREIGVSKGTIGFILSGKTWKHVED